MNRLEPIVVTASGGGYRPGEADCYSDETRKKYYLKEIQTRDDDLTRSEIRLTAHFARSGVQRRN